jgi:hypothetical protein
MKTFDHQRQLFHDRISRIASASGAPLDAAEGAGRHAQTWAEMLENARYPARFLIAFLLGALVVFVIRYARFHLGYGALAGEMAGTLMATDLALALASGFLLRYLIHLEAHRFQIAHGLGVIVMVLGMHNLVHWAPQAFTPLFSRGWVSEVIRTTDQNSLLIRGTSIVMTETGERPAATAGRPRRIVLDSERR